MAGLISDLLESRRLPPPRGFDIKTQGVFMRHLACKALAATLVLGSAAVQAENVDFLGFTHGSKSVSYALTAPNIAKSGSANAGGFLTSVNNGPSFEAYCIDLYQTINFSDPAYGGYTQVAGSAHTFANSTAVADLGRLFAAGHAVNDAKSEAAFQIAVWEIAYETTGAYSLNGGDATFAGGTAASSGALTLASGWLASLGSGPGVGIDVLESSAHQDVVFAAPVPEPGTYALMLAGLAALGAVARRRQTRS